MNKTEMLEAFRRLDRRLPASTRIIIGGGAALLAAYDIPITTRDVDGVPDKSSMELSKFKAEVRAVGKELGLPPDWLNDWFATFLFVLPAGYADRLVSIYTGRYLEVSALGKEELILMKCFAGRERDIPHIKLLIRKGADLKIVSDRLQEHLEKGIPGASKAADLFDDLCGELGVTV